VHDTTNWFETVASNGYVTLNKDGRLSWHTDQFRSSWVTDTFGGVSGLYSWGCACTRFATPRTWPVLAGRLQLPLMAAMMVDLHLQVALLLDQLGLPAALARTVLTVAVQDFIDEVEPKDGNDWWALSRRAQQLDRRRLEDYVAVAAAVDGPLVPEENESAREP